MKHWLLFILVISWFCFPLSGQQTNRPDWVKQHPVSGLSYIGIGMAEISEGDYQQKAKQNALSDLVSEIQVVIAANSLLNTLEDDGNVKQTVLSHYHRRSSVKRCLFHSAAASPIQ